METFELYFYETRRKVRDNSKDLILKIRMHEERLLEEIEATKQSEYAKVTFTKAELDESIKKLNAAYMKGATLSDQKIGDINKVERDITKQVEFLDRDERFNAAALMKFSVLSYSPVRCNTAFGTVNLLETEATVNQSPPGSATRERNVSVPPFPGIEGSRSPSFKLKTRTTSLGTLLGDSLTCPALTLGTLAVPPTSIMGRSPTITRKPPPTPLLKHLWIKEMEQEGLASDCKATCMWSLSVDGSAPGQISGPNDVDFLPDGNILVCDRDNHRLQVFDKVGSFVKIIVSGTLKPRRLSVISEGHIAVTDSSDSTVKVFDQKDECIIIWGKKWYKSIFKSPCGIAINSKQQPIVSDMERHSVTVYDEEGKKIRQLQCDGSSKTDFHSPSYVAVDCNDRIIVADNWSQSVKVFSSKGKYLFQFNKTDDDNRLKYPNGVCSDEKGNIYVADWGNHRVTKFDSRGVFIQHVLTKEDGLHHPAGLAIAKDTIAVTAFSDLHSYVGLFKLSK